MITYHLRLQPPGCGAQTAGLLYDSDWRASVLVTPFVPFRGMGASLAVFGLGYVGSVSAACLAARGHRVIGVDTSTQKVDRINMGRAPIVEADIGELVERVVADRRLTATIDFRRAVASSSVALVCVGTPSLPSGALDTRHLERVAEQIGAVLPTLGRRYVVVIRSTMLPNTAEQVVIPILEKASGLVADRDFDVCVNPEFLREGTSVRDFFEPPKTVVGEISPGAGNAVAQLYEGLPGPLYQVPLAVAEMAKYVDNSFHALKVTFANEVGALCKALQLDSHQVMDIFKSDTKLNVSPAYLTPGFAFGGSCLPKDLRALLHHARHSDVRLPMLEGVLPSNEYQIQRLFEMVITSGATNVGLLGLSFKSGTDDLRESPMVDIAERLLGRGLNLRIHDAQVSMSHLHGANRMYVEQRIPHLADLLVADPADAVRHSDLVIVATQEPRALSALAYSDRCTVIDLVRPRQLNKNNERYVGFAW